MHTPLILPDHSQIQSLRGEIVDENLKRAICVISVLLAENVARSKVIDIRKRDVIEYAARSPEERSILYEDRDLHMRIGQYFQTLGWKVECLTAVGQWSMPSSTGEYWKFTLE